MGEWGVVRSGGDVDSGGGNVGGNGKSFSNGGDGEGNGCLIYLSKHAPGELCGGTLLVAHLSQGCGHGGVLVTGIGDRKSSQP